MVCTAQGQPRASAAACNLIDTRTGFAGDEVHDGENDIGTQSPCDTSTDSQKGKSDEEKNAEDKTTDSFAAPSEALTAADPFWKQLHLSTSSAKESKSS